MRYRFLTADVFTDTPFGGNPLAVLPDARGLDDATMLRVAREFNLSETVFVLPPDDPRHTRRLRIFTPGGELPFAGHPTVGTAIVLATIGEVPAEGGHARIVFEEGVGPVPVVVEPREGRPGFARLTAARPPERGAVDVDRTALAEMLSLAPEDVRGGAGDAWAPEAWSCGVPFLFVPLRDRGAVARARLRLDRWEATLAGRWAEKIYLFALDPERPGSDVRARMFAPSIGVAEDPATGAAAAAFAGYLAARAEGGSAPRAGTRRWMIEQGFEMGRPSLLEVEAEVDATDGTVRAARVGGAAVLMSEGTLNLPEAPPA